MLDRAIELAKTSTCTDYKFGCVAIRKNGCIVATGVNRRKTHPFQAKMAKKLGEPKKIWLHAEIAALVKCRETPYAIYVARVDKNDKIKRSEPCPICMMAIKESGCKRLVYTKEDNRFEIVKL